MARRLIAALALALLAPGLAHAALPGGREIAVRTSIAPDVHLFAEPVVARTMVIVDPAAFDPDRVTVETSFLPYEQVGSVERRRRDVGGAVELAFAATLRCLDVACLAPRYRTVLGEQEGGRAERYTFRFPPASVLYRQPDGSSELVLQQPFPGLEVVSRINTALLQSVEEGFGDPATASPYAARLDSPPPTYRLAPELLAGLALALAAAFLVLPAALAVRFLLARWRARRLPRALGPLERALVLVDWSGGLGDGEQDRRRALDALAAVLEENGAEPLADAARTLAWGEDAPDRDRAGALAGEARRAVGGGDGGAR